VVDAIEPLARADPDVGQWIVDIDRHGRRCDVINGR
jgi:hypothetical protein